MSYLVEVLRIPSHTNWQSTRLWQKCDSTLVMKNRQIRPEMKGRQINTADPNA